MSSMTFHRLLPVKKLENYDLGRKPWKRGLPSSGISGDSQVPSISRVYHDLPNATMREMNLPIGLSKLMLLSSMKSLDSSIARTR